MSHRPRTRDRLFRYDGGLFRVPEKEKCDGEKGQRIDLIVSAKTAIIRDNLLIGGAYFERPLQMNARVNESSREMQRLAHEPVGQRRHPEVLVLRRQSQALSGNFDRRGMFRPHAVAQVVAPEDRHLFRRGATIAEQVTGAREYP